MKYLVCVQFVSVLVSQFSGLKFRACPEDCPCPEISSIDQSMTDPVIYENGRTYERRDISKWMKTQNISAKLIPNKALRNAKEASEQNKTEIQRLNKIIESQFGSKFCASKKFGRLDGSFLCPGFFLCPISRKLIRDPVVIDGNGVTYDRSSITNWMKTSSNYKETDDGVQLMKSFKNLMTDEWVPVESVQLINNIALRSAMKPGIQQVNEIQDLTNTIAKLEEEARIKVSGVAQRT